MFGTLRRLVAISSTPRELERFEPIYGLPHRALQEWLSQNSQLRQDYDIELASRALRGRATSECGGIEGNASGLPIAMC